MLTYINIDIYMRMLGMQLKQLFENRGTLRNSFLKHADSQTWYNTINMLFIDSGQLKPALDSLPCSSSFFMKTLKIKAENSNLTHVLFTSFVWCKCQNEHNLIRNVLALLKREQLLREKEKYKNKAGFTNLLESHFHRNHY